VAIKAILIGIVLLLISYPLYLWITYIDETVTSGQAYGFEIGATKKEVYAKLPAALSKIKSPNELVFIQIKASEKTASALATDADFDVMVAPLFHAVGYESFRDHDSWSFYINASFFNNLKLDFCDDKLCKIHRHRKYFELP
tara:strand:- start:317 stop:742 length:426 start_codon:yes stop_codon:yes gene_type:complete